MSRLSFYDWAARYPDDGTPVGDLCVELTRGYRFRNFRPRTCEELERRAVRVIDVEASITIMAVRKAWTLYWRDAQKEVRMVKG